MKYIREKLDTPDGVKVFYRKEVDSDALCPFEVVASRMGVMVSGPRPLWLESTDDLEDFAKTISAAWQDHKALKPRIVSPEEA